MQIVFDMCLLLKVFMYTTEPRTNKQIKRFFYAKNMAL